MKKLYTRTLMLALCIFSFSACQEFSIDSQPEGALNMKIDAQDSYTALATSPSNVVFNISSNTPWTITSDQQWCKPSPAMSASSSLVSEIVVTMENNEGKQSRTAKLIVKAEGVEATKVITITQTSKEDLMVIPYDEIVPTEGGQISFKIASNKAWEVIPSTAFISDIDKKTGTGNENATEETIIIKIPANAGARREGQITVQTDFQKKTFTITQNGVVIEQEEPSESGTIDFGWSQKEKIVKIRANKAWKVKVPKEYAEWISAEALNDSELKITLLKSSNKLVSRKGQVLLSTVEVISGFEGIPFEITQAPQFYFPGNASNRIVDETTGNVKMMSVVGNNINSNFALKKGHLIVEFAEVNMTGESRLYFNMWPDVGNTNFNFPFTSGASVTCGGGFEWEQKTFTLTNEEIKAVRKIEFFVEDDSENIGKLRIRMLLNGVEKVNLKNKTNVYVSDPSNNPGQKIYLQLTNAKEGESYTIKSITHEPAE